MVLSLFLESSNVLDELLIRRCFGSMLFCFLVLLRLDADDRGEINDNRGAEVTEQRDIQDRRIFTGFPVGGACEEEPALADRAASCRQSKKRQAILKSAKCIL